MKIFNPLGADDYELAQPINSDDFDTLRKQIDGTPRRDSWVPIRMRIFTEEADGQPLLESDAPWFGSDALIFRAHAARVMEPLLAPHGELLPLACESAELVVFNCTRIVAALDEKASEVRRFSDDGRIFRIVRHVLRPELIRDVSAFKLKSLDVCPVYVNEEFVTRWNEAGLRGLTFTQVWEG